MCNNKVIFGETVFFFLSDSRHYDKESNLALAEGVRKACDFCLFICLFTYLFIYL